MPWNLPGSTIKRIIPDQTVSVTSWGNSTQILPFRYLRTVGYLSALYLQMPAVLQTYTSNPVGATYGVLSPSSTYAQLNIINRFQLTLQAIATLYDIRGYSLGFLNYVGNGNANAHAPHYGHVGANLYFTTIGSGGGNFFPFEFPSVPSWLGAVQPVNSGPSGNYLVDSSTPGIFIYNPGALALPTTQEVILTYNERIPISETIRFPNTVIETADKQHLVVDAPMEMGMIFMQNNQQNVTPTITLSKLYATDIAAIPNDDAVFLEYSDVAGVYTITPWQNIQWLLEDEFYDVPPDPMNRPYPFQLSFAVTRTETDYYPAGQAVTVKYRAAGLLCRVVYVGYQGTSQGYYPFDLGYTTNGFITNAQQTYASITFKSGATITTVQETAPGNMARSQIRYGGPMPGILVHDFIGDTAGAGASIVQAVDLGSLVDVRTEFTALPQLISRLCSVEQRLIPVEVSQ